MQIGYLGSSPLTAAITRKVPVQTFLIATQIGAAEALVAREGSGINSPQDLIGKKIAVPFVSTGHYSLLAALKHWNIDPSKVTVLNLAPPAIIAAWKRGDIDATYVWDPALGVAKENGKVLITSGELAKFGAPTFDAWIVRKDFAEKHPEIVTAFAKVTLDAYADYRKDPQAWLANQGNVDKLVKLSGAKASDIPLLLQGNVLRWHFVSAAVLTTLVIAYIAFLVQQGLGGRLTFRLAALKSPDRGTRWAAINKLVYWISFGLLLGAFVTGVLVYLFPGTLPTEPVVRIHELLSWGFVLYMGLHVLAQVVMGGVRQLLKIMSPRLAYGLAYPFTVQPPARGQVVGKLHGVFALGVRGAALHRVVACGRWL